MLPLAAPGYLVGGIMAFAHTVGEFGVVLMIGGNIPGETKVISIAIYDSVEPALDRGASAIGRHGVFAFAVIFITLVAGRRSFLPMR